VPGIFIAASTIIVVNRMVSEPIDSLVGLGIVAAGIPVYYIWVKPV
jgi:APA family basic amino acid/polyamine antiporter